MLYHSHDCTQGDLTPCSQTRTMAVVQLYPVDFVSRLPPEIVLDIVLNLGVEDVVQCLLVSKQWHDILSGLEPYWRRACLEFGLPDHVVGRLRPRYATSKALLFAARQHRQSICATRPQCFSLSQESYPYDTHYACQYTNGDMILGTVYRDFRPKEIIVERVCYRSVVRVRTLFPQFASTAENRIIWGYLSQEFLLCVTASGIWSAYDSSINSPLFRWKSDSMYDSDIRIGCCEKCLVVCTAKLFSFRNEESYWDLKVFKVGRDFFHSCSQCDEVQNLHWKQRDYVAPSKLWEEKDMAASKFKTYRHWWVLPVTYPLDPVGAHCSSTHTHLKGKDVHSLAASPYSAYHSM